MAKNLIFWLFVGLVLMLLINNFGPRHGGVPAQHVAYSKFITDIKAGRITKVKIDGPTIQATMNDGNLAVTYSPETSNGPLIRDLLDNKVEIEGQAPDRQGLFMQIFISWFPMLLLIGVWIFFMRQMQGGGGGRGAMSFGKSRARMLSDENIKITFADVAGVDEAKDEVKELVEFLRDPGKFKKLGGMIPQGVLMVGSPGTGKTLLAKAIAGEAKVPFFTISGSDFVEMFVGVGASRVRDMFEQAKKHAPCIIFIDEIDAVGRHRGAGLGGGHDEREQTLNQLLVEMDGFEGNEGVIVIAATNRPDVLDPALLRPGRFDRQVVVPLPDIRGREQILKVHMRKVPVDDDVNAAVLARGTPGMSGADLANLVNEAALFAARRGKKRVNQTDFDDAKDKVMMGAERRSMVMSDEQKKLTAYHEAGHAIVGLCVPSHDPVYKVSIIPRGRALGVTMFLPDQDRISMNKEQLESQLSSLFGGRVAEEIVFGPNCVTTGASNDIDRATQIARSMVTKWGLSQRMGPQAYSEEEGEVFLGRSVTQHKMMSDQTALAIDEEIRNLIDRNYSRAEQILRDHFDQLHAMADALIRFETIDQLQIEDIMEGRPAREPKDWGDKGSTGNASPNEGEGGITINKPKSASSSDKGIGGLAKGHSA